MKKVFNCFLVTLAGLCLNLTGQDYCTKFELVLQIYNTNALNPVNEDTFNDTLFLNHLLISIDPDYTLFDNKELEILKKISVEFGVNPSKNFCHHFPEIYSIYYNCLLQSVSILDSLKAHPINFFTDDSLYTGMNPSDYYNRHSSIQRWEKQVKFMVLSEKFISSDTAAVQQESDEAIAKNLHALQASIIDRETNRLRSMLDSKEKLSLEVFQHIINSFIFVYDPHGAFFSPEMFESFQELLSDITNSFGIFVDINQNKEIVISSVVPGSYAWKTGEVRTGDIILSISAPDCDTLSLKTGNLNDLYAYLDATNTTTYIITTKNKENIIRPITIHQEEIANEETIVEAYILNGKTKIGYIELPSFYTSWENSNLFGCAQDVAKAVFLLKKEQIDALILDVRNNGGGSIKEAIELVGMFIDFGTLAIEKNKQGNLNSMKDFSRGRLYDGPMAILINSNSASASEMVAGILQDHNRAVIVGRPSFGKATGQILIPVVPPTETDQKKLNENEMEILKVTASKYYRVTGQSYQRFGIIPDVSLPYLSGLKEFKENDYANAFENDQISKKVHFIPYPQLPIDYLKNKSVDRILISGKFLKIKKIDSLWYDTGLTKEYASLYPNDYSKHLQMFNQINSVFDSFKSDTTTLYVLHFLKYQTEKMNTFAYYNDLYKENSITIMSDPYIEETYNILNDLIFYQTSKNNEH